MWLCIAAAVLSVLAILILPVGYQLYQSYTQASGISEPFPPPPEKLSPIVDGFDTGNPPAP
jgi:hypothetical protein